MKKYVRPEILAMQGYVPGEQPKPGEAVKLNTNENPYRASEKVYEAIRSVCDSATSWGLSRYPEPTAKAVREVVARRFDVEPNMVLCANGSDESLTILTRTFVRSGDLVRSATPSYILYPTLATIQGAECDLVRFNPDWSLPSAFAEPPLANEHLRLAFLANPNSPSGTVVPKDKILAFAEALPCPLVIDEAYADFADDHCIDLVKQCEKIIVCRTLSKSYSLAGLRFGFVVASPHFIEQMDKVRDSYNCDALSIAGAAAALSDEEWRNENRQKILATRARLTKRMRKLGFDVPTSQANFTWNTRTDISLEPIYQFLKRKGILVRYMPYPGIGDGLRISVGTDEVTDRCVDLIEEYLRASNVSVEE